MLKEYFGHFMDFGGWDVYVGVGSRFFQEATYVGPKMLSSKKENCRELLFTLH